jgi:hypothetical protein
VQRPHEELTHVHAGAAPGTEGPAVDTVVAPLDRILVMGSQWPMTPSMICCRAQGESR